MLRNRWTFPVLIIWIAIWPLAHANGQSSNSGPLERTVQLFMSGSLVFEDADTLFVNNQKVQLFGIEAPRLNVRCAPGDEGNTNCGADALAEIFDIIAPLQTLECLVVDIKSNGQIQSRCTSSNFRITSDEQVTMDLAEILVIRGYARAVPQQQSSGVGRYVAAEHRAQETKVGFWACTAATPAGWQRDKSRLCS